MLEGHNCRRSTCMLERGMMKAEKHLVMQAKEYGMSSSVKYTVTVVQFHGQGGDDDYRQHSLLNMSTNKQCI